MANIKEGLGGDRDTNRPQAAQAASDAAAAPSTYGAGDAGIEGYGNGG